MYVMIVSHSCVCWNGDIGRPLSPLACTVGTVITLFFQWCVLSRIGKEYVSRAGEMAPQVKALANKLDGLS